VRLVQLLSSVSRAGGGVAEAARALAHHLSIQADLDMQIVGLRDAWTEADAALWNPLAVRVCDVVGPPAFGYAPGLRRSVKQARADILHCHGLWMYPSVVSHRNSGDGARAIISPHGMLDGWALENSRWKKRLARLLFENSHLRGAACIHALSARELIAVREFGLRNPVCVIPNGIDLRADQADDSTRAGNVLGVAPAQQVLLHLGRIHPKKGLTNLLEAWAFAKKNRLAGAADWTLAIAGWEAAGSGYQQELHLRARALGVVDSVVFPGPLFGSDKRNALGRAAAFILASVSEGMPMTVLEAWSHRLPVMMTPQCNIPEGFQAGAALRVEPTIASLTDGLARMFVMSPSDRQTMGSAGRRLVEQQFTWDRAAAQLNAVYRWLLGGGGRPACVDVMDARARSSPLHDSQDGGRAATNS
jgi:glycosyltransferase involved in cell wall biosynthesis